jgi:hypothetical protein
MIEPTLTQNSALYLAHHKKASKEKVALFQRFSFRARKDRVAPKQPTISELFIWPRLQGGN